MHTRTNTHTTHSAIEKTSNQTPSPPPPPPQPVSRGLHTNESTSIDRAIREVTTTWVGLTVEISLQLKPPQKFGGAAPAGAGGDSGGVCVCVGGGFEGRVQGAEWSRRGRNSAVGCISVSRSDGWVEALFVLCCHTALAPAWALMRGGRTAGQEHGGPPTQVICHTAVLLQQGDAWRQRGETWGGGAGLNVGTHMWHLPACTDNAPTVRGGRSRWLQMDGFIETSWNLPHRIRCSCGLYRDKDEGRFRRKTTIMNESVREASQAF